MCILFLSADILDGSFVFKPLRWVKFSSNYAPPPRNQCSPLNLIFYHVWLIIRQILPFTKDQAELKVMFETVASACSFQEHPSKQGRWRAQELWHINQGIYPSDASYLNSVNLILGSEFTHIVPICRLQCCSAHTRPLPLRYTPASSKCTEASSKS